MKKQIQITSIAMCLLIIFTACSNFLNGSNLKNELEKSIEYANSNPVKVRFYSNNENLKFLSGNQEFELRKSDVKEIEFEFDSSLYKFEGLKIFDKDNPESELSSYASISYTQNNNVYKLSFKLLEGDKNLLLEVVTSYLPAVVSTEPANIVNGVISYKPIKIKFATPMNRSDLCSFDKIHITDKNSNIINDYFDNPVLSKDGLLLTIKPKANEIVKLFSFTSLETIFVNLDSSIREADERDEKFREYNFRYVINNEEDTRAPSLENYSVSRKIYDLKDFSLAQEIISNKSFEEWSTADDSDYLKNLVRDRVYLNFKVIDLDSGIKGFHIRETLLMNSFGDNVNNITNEETYYDVTETSDGVFESKDFEYKLWSGDGVVKLDVDVFDYFDYKVSFSCYVVKHSSVDIASTYKFAMEDTEERYADNNGIDSFTRPVTIDAIDTFLPGKSVPARIKIAYFDEGESAKTLFDSVLIDSTKQNYTTVPVTLTRIESKVTTVTAFIDTVLGEHLEKVYYIYPSMKKLFYNAYYKDFNIFIEIMNKPSNSKVKYQTNQNDADNWYKSGWENSYINHTNVSRIKKITYKISLWETPDNSIISCCISTPILLTAYETEENWKFTDESSIIDFPELTLSAEAMAEGTGKHKITAYYTSYGSAGYYFRLGYKPSDKTAASYKEYHEITETSFEVDSTVIDASHTDSYYYDFFIECYDSSGLLLDTKQLGDMGIDTSKDNSPLLVLDYYTEHKSYGLNLINFKPYVYFTNVEGHNLEMDYWLIPNKGSVERPDYTDESIEYEKYTKWTCPIVKSEYSSWSLLPGTVTETAVIPLNVSENDYYSLIYRLRDNTTGKVSVKGKYVINNRQTNFLNNQKLIYEDGNFYIPFTEVYNDAKAKQVAAIDNEWVYAKYDIQSTSEINGEKYFKLKIDASLFNDVTEDNLNSSIMKIYFSGILDGTYSQPLYICQDYYDKKITANRADVIAGMKGAQIYADCPFIAETLYNETRLESEDKWEAWGLCADLKTAKEDMYYMPALDKVEAGNYYVTMVHFADGTRWMSDVKQKK